MQQGDLISFVITFISVLIELMIYAIIARIIVSWFNLSSYGQPKGRFSIFLFQLTDPILNVFKKFPHKIGMLDLSPMIAIITLSIGGRFLINIIISMF